MRFNNLKISLKKRTRIFLFGLGGTFIFINLLYFYVPRFVVEVKNPFIETARTYILNEPKIQIKQKNDIINFYWEGYQNTKLNANLYKSLQQPARATIILIHGIRSQKENWDNIARFLQKNGYNAIAIDLRAHGQSEGTFCTFGYYEKQDIAALIKYIHSQLQLNTPIGIWGHSLGGVISLQTLAVQPDIKFGIIESAYSDFKQITNRYSKNYLPFESEMFHEFLIERAGEIAEFEPEKVNPEDFIPQIRQPVLFLHGENDNKIPLEHALKNLKNIKHHDKKIIIVKNANHYNIWEEGGSKLQQQILVFFENSLKQTNVNYPL